MSFFLEPGYQVKPEESPAITLIPVSFADTVSYLGGADLGPDAILQASHALELFDDELLIEPWQAGIATLPPVDCKQGLEAMSASVNKEVESILVKGGLPIVLGGEHSVSIGAITACKRHFPELVVVQVDAHLDLRDQYDGLKTSHACVMRRLDDLGIDFFQVGIRSFSRQEWELCENRGWQPWTMHRIRNENWIEKIRQNLAGRPLYLTFDVDGLDPAVMPATGTPEPDGLSWQQATELIATIVDAGRLVGCDFVELAPQAGPAYSAFTAAKLVYRTIGYWWRKQCNQS